MDDAMVAGTAIENFPETEVLVGEVDSTMSDLMLAARQAENLKPLTEEEADGMTVAQLGDRAALIFSHYKCALMSERDFILRFRVELNVLRRKTTQQGRRLPIPGCPTWGEVKRTYFKLSGRQIDALLADPKPDKTEPEPEPTEVREITVSDDRPETPTPSDEAVEKIHEAANEPDPDPGKMDAIFPVLDPEQQAAVDTFGEHRQDEEIAKLARGVMEEKLKSLNFSTDLRTHLLASFPDIVSGKEYHDDNEFHLCDVRDDLKSLVDFIRTLPPIFVTTLYEAAEHVEHENTNKWLADRRRKAIVAILEEARDAGLPAKEIQKKMPFPDSKLFSKLKNGLEVGLWTFRNGRYHAAEKLEPDQALALAIIDVMERDSAIAYSAEALADHISGATVKEVQRVLERGINEGGSWVCVDETEGTYMLESAYEAWQESQANDEPNEQVNE